MIQFSKKTLLLIHDANVYSKAHIWKSDSLGAVGEGVTSDII